MVSVLNYFPKREGIDLTHTELGFSYSGDYWMEGKCYVISQVLKQKIEDTTNELYSMAIDYVSQIITSGDYPDEYGLSDMSKFIIEDSYNRQIPSIFSRFDLGVQDNQVKMFEYNSDNPVMLLESAMAQKKWHKEVMSHKSQFNNIESEILSFFAKFSSQNYGIDFVHYSSAILEDISNMKYLSDLAKKAGLKSQVLDFMTISQDPDLSYFLDSEEVEIQNLYKNYPWHFLLSDDFAELIPYKKTNFMNPAWTYLLSSKEFLALIWKKHKGHPNLLEAYLTSNPPSNSDFILKPLQAVGGRNCFKISDGKKSSILPGSNYFQDIESNYISQAWFDSVDSDGIKIAVGSFVVSDRSCGIGIYSASDNTCEISAGDNCKFVPHFVED